MIGRMILCLALVSGAGAASAQNAACTLYKVNASVLPISKEAGGGSNIGALEDGDVACVTRQQKVEGSDWGYISHKLEKPKGRKQVDGWATLRYMNELSPTEAAAFETATTTPPPAPTVPPAPAAAAPPPLPAADADAGFYQRATQWVSANTTAAMTIGAGFALAAISLLLFAVRRRPEAGAALVDEASTDKKTRLIEEDVRPVVYGWLETLDGNPSRYPLGAVDMRIGRDHDNDVRLHNDSISRQHALVHFDADKGRFVIKDLGGTNGVIVNTVRHNIHELSDGDLVQLGEVRLRFRANTEGLGR